MVVMAAPKRIPASRLLAIVMLGLVVGSSVAPGRVVAAGSLGPTVASPGSETAGAPLLSAWTGGVSLYRNGTFTTQRSWLWCTAAGVQIVRNIVDHRADHSTSGQRAYFDWMRKRNRYDLPVSAGVDPQGWTAGLRHFVDDRYRLVASRTFDEALRSAVERLRRTNLPVAITVSHGGHGWIMTGFQATADPAATSSFKVTSVRVVGPLYGLQSKNGYDMPPNTKLTPTQLKRFFTPWKYDPKPMIWDGRYVSIQPIPVKATPPTATATPAAPATATPGPSPVMSAATAQPSIVATGLLEPLAVAGPTAAPVLGVVAAAASPGLEASDPEADDPTAAGGVPLIGLILAGFFTLATLGALAARSRSRPSAR